MRYSLVAFVLAAVSAAAIAQDAPAGTWSFFEQNGQSGATLDGDRGTLVLKCDKAGRREVYAMILANSDRLAVPAQRPVARPISVQFDTRGRQADNWRLYEKYATALGKTGDRTLARFVVGLRGATKANMIIDTGIGADVTMAFDVTGADAIVKRVYEACKDTLPT